MKKKQAKNLPHKCRTALEQRGWCCWEGGLVVVQGRVCQRCVVNLNFVRPRQTAAAAVAAGAVAAGAVAAGAEAAAALAVALIMADNS